MKEEEGERGGGEGEGERGRGGDSYQFAIPNSLIPQSKI